MRRYLRQATAPLSRDCQNSRESGATRNPGAQKRSRASPLPGLRHHETASHAVRLDRSRHSASLPGPFRGQAIRVNDTGTSIQSEISLHWPVHSSATTTLMSDLFHRIAQNPNETRSASLQQSQLAMINTHSYQENGKAAFSYAHPIFWAPFTLVGDGGGGTRPAR